MVVELILLLGERLCLPHLHLEVHSLKRPGKRYCQYPAFSSFVFTKFLSPFIPRVCFFDQPFPDDILVKAFLVLLSLVNLSPSYALVFLTPSLQNQAAFLYSSQITCPVFCEFLPLSLTSRSWLMHAHFFPSFPDFLCESRAAVLFGKCLERSASLVLLPCPWGSFPCHPIE